MIDNSNKVGYFSVVVIGKYNCVNSFQCPTLHDAKLEAEKIQIRRTKNRLTTTSAVARQIVAREGKALTLGDPIMLLD